MTQDEIIEMAKQAHGPLTGTWWDMDIAALDRFAKLVAAKEREACANLCLETYPTLEGAICASRIRARGKA